MSLSTTASKKVETVSLQVLAVPAIAIALAFAVLGATPHYPMVAVLVGMAVGSLVLVLNRPAWLLAPLLLVELSVSNYIIPEAGISFRLAVVLVATVLAAPMILSGTRLVESQTVRVLLPAVAFVVLVTLMNTVHSDSDYVFKYFRYQFTQLIALVLAACLIEDRRDLKRLVIVALAIGVASGFAAIWQHYGRHSAPYGMATAATVANWKGRAVGFSDNPVLLANEMPFLLLPLLGLLAVSPPRLSRGRILLIGAAFILFAGLQFTYTRSALFGLAPGLLIIGLLLRGRRRLIVLGALISAVIMFFALEGTGIIGSRYYRDASEDQSAASHEALWRLAYAVAVDHWVDGIGHEQFEEVAKDYIDEVEGGEAGEDQRPHNDFLSVWLSWGILALVLYVGIFLGAIVNCVQAARSGDVLIRGLAIGCAGGLITYAANSAFHNYLDSSSVLWIYAGLSATLARMPARVPAVNPARPRVPRRPFGQPARQYVLWG